MAHAWPARRQPWPAIFILVSLCVGALVRLPPTVSAEGLFFRTNRDNHGIKSTGDLHNGQWPSSNYACICLEGDQDRSLAQCPLYPPHPFCPQAMEGDVEVDHKAAQSSPNSPTIATATHQHEDPHDRVVAINPASSPTIAGSTVLVTGDIPVATVTVVPGSQASVSVAAGHIDHGDSALDSATTSPGQPPEPSSIFTPPQSTAKAQQPSAIPAAATVQATPPQPERHIPSYEQWRKQALEKKSKPVESKERKQRKRKPYQESPVDVAIGGEDELGFVFPNLDGNGKGNDDRFQHLADQLGNGPDLKKEPKAQEWIKSEYAKDPKDRFNHASATCAASVVKASKDATSIMAILNEGKDNYMLNKCSTKEKFFVVELCEEILVDAFILGNYEFFSSTFKDFVVSVNRYPPRDDGWSILGHFQARNTRDAQVFRPATPQLATYIRFDFVSHYGNEYYCPVTLLRVYGATALEQLKQEEEEEKRIAMEEKKQAELEKAKQAEEEDAEDDDDDSEVPEVPPGSKDEPIPTPQEDIAAPNEAVDVDEDRQDTTEHSPLKEMTGTPDMDSPPLEEGNPHDELAGSYELDLEDFPQKTADSDSLGLFSEHSNESTYIIPEWPTDVDQHTGEPTPTDAPLPSTAMLETETVTQPSEQLPSDVLPPLPSTSPASMQDDNDWKNVDLGIITLSQKTRPTHLSKPPSASKGSASGVGTTGASATDPVTSHAVPSPGHSSQESVYKNIVNRLKVLELNSSLSYLYLEEQSNIFNEVIDSSTQKINQLVNHLNEANRRLEVLGRKYDQLSYSYRAHVEVDGEKRRKDFLNLSNQVHVLGAQVLFQRQLFVVAVITIITVFVFVTLTKSSTMHYAIQHSPLGAKLRAISGHKRRTGQNDIVESVRIGSVESLSNFEQNSRRHHIFTTETGKPVDEDSKYTPPLSPMSPLTPNPNHDSRLLDNQLQSQTCEPLPDPISSSAPREDNGEASNVESTTSKHQQPITEASLPVDSPEMIPNPLFEHFQHTRTPYSTPQHSYPDNKSLVLSLTPLPLFQTSQQPQQYPLDYRPGSPVFQGPSSSNDAGQLSDADVAYMSRDMNVGRTSSSGSLLPNTPSMKRLSASYYNQFHHSAARPSSSLRRDTTLSLASRTDSDSPDRQDQSPDILHSGLHASPDQVSPDQQEPTNETIQDTQGASGTGTTERPSSKMERPYQDADEDVGFVSDSVLDSAPENMGGRKIHLGDWDRHHGVGESALESLRDSVSGSDTFNQPTEATGQPEPNKEANGHSDFVNDSLQKERPKLGRECSKNSRRRSSHSIQRPQEFVSAVQYKNHSASAALGLGVGLGLELGDHDRQDGEAVDYDGDRDDRGFDSTDGIVPTWIQLSTSSAATGVAVSSKTLKKKRSKKLLEDQIVPRRKVSYDRQGSNESGHGNGALEDDDVDRGQEGDDERSPQVSRKGTS